MRAAAFGLVLSSAVLHAGWNLVMKRSRDRLVAGWAIATTGALVFLPVLFVVGLPDRSVWGHVLASGTVHVAYAVFLAAAYDRVDLSIAYPLARGISPLLIAAGGVLWLDDHLAALAWAGVAVTSAGLLFVALHAVVLRGLEWAVLTGLAITTYTLIDTAGVRTDDQSLRYVVAVFVVQAVIFAPVMMRSRGLRPAWGRFRDEAWMQTGAGVLSVAAYALVLAAAILAPIGAVSAVRETSVVLGALAGWLLLGEDFGRRRTGGACIVAAGVVLLALA